MAEISEELWEKFSVPDYDETFIFSGGLGVPARVCRLCGAMLWHEGEQAKTQHDLFHRMLAALARDAHDRGAPGL